MKGFFQSVLLVATMVLPLFSNDFTVVGIGIGEKNSTLDESKFPNISVYYTPTITVRKKGLSELEYSGSPEELVEWFNGVGAAGDFWVLGSNGVVYDQGQAITDGKYMEDVDTERRGTMKKSIQGVTEKGRSLKESKKAPDSSDLNGWIKRKFPSCELTTPSGDKVSSSSVIPNDKPVLIVFFYLNPETYIGVEKDDGSKARTKENMRGRMESASGVEGVRPLIQVEREIFDNPVHDIY